MDFERPPRTLPSLSERQRDTTQWPQVNLPSIKGKKNRERFLTLRSAIIDYMEGVSPKKICATYKLKAKNGKMRNLCKSELFYYRDRCLEVDSRGALIGFAGLLKYYHFNKKLGPLLSLFKQYRALERYMQALFFKRSRELGQSVFEVREPFKGLHKKFLTACSRLAIPGDQYPYSYIRNGRKVQSISKGIRSLTQYFKELIDQDPARAGLVRYGEKTARKIGSGQDHVRLSDTEPLAITEFDAHCIDALWTLNVWDKFRKRYVKLILNRIWLLIVIDEFSRAVLGYYLCLKDAYNQYDVMRAVKRAVEPWTPMDFVAVEKFSYPPRGGFPSGVIDRYAWAAWNLMIYDNAWANLATKTREIIKRAIGSDVNPGPKYTPDHQPFVERFNGTFTKDIIQRLPNTTGKGPTDERRNDPENSALEFDMNVDELRELVEISLATYNVTPHSAHGDMSPMQVLDRFAADQNHIIKTIPINRRSQLTWMNVEVTKKVRGGLEQQRRPYIHFYGVDYSNEILGGAPSMVGKKIKLVYDPTEDARTIAAYTENGRSLGTLMAKGQWAISPHTFDLRHEIMTLKKAKIIFYQEHADPVQVYIEHLNEKALRHKRARGRLITAQQLAHTENAYQKGNAETPHQSLRTSTPDTTNATANIEKRTYSKRRARNM